MFCQLHMGSKSLKAECLLGDNLEDSVENVIACLDSCLKKVESLKGAKFFEESTECLLLVDQLLGWLSFHHEDYLRQVVHMQNFYKIRKERLPAQISKVIKVCFKWLGEPISYTIPAKLLLTLVNIGQNFIS